jgi:hypothetical protein
VSGREIVREGTLLLAEAFVDLPVVVLVSAG